MFSCNHYYYQYHYHTFFLRCSAADSEIVAYVMDKCMQTRDAIWEKPCLGEAEIM